MINCGISQGSVLGPLLFLLCINDPNQAVKICKVDHSADDTNHMSNSIITLNKLVDADLKRLVNWNNKISLSVKKTEIVIFKSKWMKFEGDLKMKLYGKRLILLKVLNTWVWKLIQTLVSNIILMIFPLNWIEPMLSFSKWENMLVLRSIYFAILTLSYPTGPFHANLTKFGEISVGLISEFDEILYDWEMKILKRISAFEAKGVLRYSLQKFWVILAWGWFLTFRPFLRSYNYVGTKGMIMKFYVLNKLAWNKDLQKTNTWRNQVITWPP